MNTLFKKGYLLAGVIIAANMFIVNEVKASSLFPENNIDTKTNPQVSQYVKKEEIPSVNKDILNNAGENAPFPNIILNCKNYINFIGGMASSGVNSYFKWWNYNPGWYRQFGCFGWRSGRFLKDIFQFDINLNIGRGAGWMLLYFLYPLITKLWKKENLETGKSEQLTETHNLMEDSEELKEAPKTSFKFKDFIFSCAPGFISVPLAIHISTFSIAISLDSILWELLTIVVKKKDKASSLLNSTTVNFSQTTTDNKN